MRKTMLVVPTCRPEALGPFLDAWGERGGWDEVCVVEDAPERSPEITQMLPAKPLYRHYSHAEIADHMGKDAWIISKRDSAIRCFGFLIAHQKGMGVLTLDDDCLPTPEGYREGTLVAAHQAAVRHPRWAPSVPGMRTRGLPYRNLGKLESMVNVGLWTGIPDLDGPQSLLHPVTGFVPPPGNRLVPAGQFIPVCGMNLYVRHAALPLMYFPLMGEGQPFKRFDDIWAGVLAKKALDVLGWHLSVGEPFVEHRRASDPFTNLVKEAPGIVANETFWEMVDRISLGCHANPVSVMGELGVRLEQQQDGYVKRLGQALQVWARLFEATK